MADAGYRSIEVSVVNNTQATLNVRTATITGVDTGWIDGEQATVGEPIEQYAGALWGVSTDNPAATAGATVHLSGFGNVPVAIDFRNDQFGTSTVNATGNDKIRTSVGQLQTSDPNHTIFQVELLPAQTIAHTQALALRGVGGIAGLLAAHKKDK
ncbi:hypothetical protein D7V97_05075 [Corallococcus sp. CA053C]|uniref:hypothetical protein n=1 Tax=Corallococcus sp. CA053C TaxID=2316732 RepID=UPI000EA02A1F|nr:hypothetical protein [Corallococcus sp. CA053C]RKH13589.1 hypothetical protein D7V97_05075 [Corallococcus sp. CA053C]